MHLFIIHKQLIICEGRLALQKINITDYEFDGKISKDDKKLTCRKYIKSNVIYNTNHSSYKDLNTKKIGSNLIPRENWKEIMVPQCYSQQERSKNFFEPLFRYFNCKRITWIIE